MSNNNNGSPLYQSHSLSRSNTFTRMNVSPKCFGTSQYIHKEEHERECRRWQAKLDEAEERLVEASVNNSDMMQIKAELNKKIVELEKNQRPLIEQNKRLNDRNRIIQQELKKVEEKLCHAQDDYLTLKDAFDRLSKDNHSLREQRAFPEKVKELDRYRNQVLEYSKCINALRQSGIEKDRRYDLLVQKFKRMKKCLVKRSEDDDRHSSYGSEGSTESSINLDTITEDIDESLEIDHSSCSYDHEVAMKLNALAFGEEQMLKEQLEAANTAITELQSARENMDEYATKISKKLQDLQHTCNSLRIKLANAEEHNDLLEFQILEFREMSEIEKEIATEDKCVETEQYVSENEAENVFEEIRAFVKMDSDVIEKAKKELKKLRMLAALKTAERDAVKKGLQHIENLENKLSFAETELNMATCEIRRIESAKADEIRNLTQQLDEAETRTSKKKKELQSDLDSTKKECAHAVKHAQEKEKQIGVLENKIKDYQTLLQQNESSSATEKQKIEELTKEITQLQTELQTERTLSQQQKETQIEAINNLSEALTSSKSSYSNINQEKENLVEEIASLRNQLEEKQKQFQSNIEELKTQLSSRTENYESQIKESSEKISKLENDCAAVLLETEKLKAELQRKEAVVKTTHDECNFKVAEKSKEHNLVLEKYRKEKENEIALLTKAKTDTEEALSKACAEIEALKSQIRPIGSQLERRFEETRFRLQEANNLNLKYEEMLNVANKRINEFESTKENVQDYLKEIQQLKIYNHELEDQFNAQMEIISALKKKFLLLNNNTDHAPDSDNWTKSNVQPSLSTEDEQYHSEGSSSAGSYNIVRNKA